MKSPNIMRHSADFPFKLYPHRAPLCDGCYTSVMCDEFSVSEESDKMMCADLKKGKKQTNFQ